MKSNENVDNRDTPPMNAVKKRAFANLTTVASEIDRHRDDTVLRIRDSLTLLGDDLQPDIVAAWETYCSSVAKLRGIRLALSRNEAEIESRTNTQDAAEGQANIVIDRSEK